MHDQSLFIREKHPFTLTLSRPSFLAQSWNRLAGKQGRASYSERASQRKTGSPGLALSCVCLWCYLWQNRWARTTEVLSSGCSAHASWNIQNPTSIGGTAFTLGVTVTPITYEHFFKVLSLVSVISVIYKQIHIVFFLSIETTNVKCPALGHMVNTR